MKFQDKIRAAVEARKAKVNQAVEELYENEEFVSEIAKLYSKNEEVKKLEKILIQLNSIKPFISKQGDKFTVKVFPQSPFKLGLNYVIGIILGSRSAFTDEMAIQYEAITGIPYTTLATAREYLGNAAYINKDGELVDETPSNIDIFYQILRGILIEMDLPEILTELNKDDLKQQIDLWKTISRKKAEKQLEELSKTANLDTTNFVIE